MDPPSIAFKYVEADLNIEINDVIQNENKYWCIFSNNSRLTNFADKNSCIEIWQETLLKIQSMCELDLRETVPFLQLQQQQLL